MHDTSGASIPAAPSRAEAWPDLAVAREISAELNRLLADAFALYVKTKNFHWHVTGRHFRDHHFLLDEQASQILAMTDPMAERCRKLGATTLRSIGDIARRQRIRDNEEERWSAKSMLAELLSDNEAIALTLRTAHEICDRHGDVATASLIENWIDEAEGRAWFLKATTIEAEEPGNGRGAPHDY
jgi:starvation-inducible DNA-binding protein